MNSNIWIQVLGLLFIYTIGFWANPLASFLLDWVFSQHICLCTTCVSGACRGQKRKSESLEVELKTLVSCHMGVWESDLEEQQVLLLAALTQPYPPLLKNVVS